MFGVVLAMRQVLGGSVARRSLSSVCVSLCCAAVSAVSAMSVLKPPHTHTHTHTHTHSYLNTYTHTILLFLSFVVEYRCCAGHQWRARERWRPRLVLLLFQDTQNVWDEFVCCTWYSQGYVCVRCVCVNGGLCVCVCTCLYCTHMYNMRACMFKICRCVCLWWR